MSFVCDGESDCLDKSDEDEKECQNKGKVPIKWFSPSPNVHEFESILINYAMWDENLSNDLLRQARNKAESRKDEIMRFSFLANRRGL